MKRAHNMTECPVIIELQPDVSLWCQLPSGHAGMHVHTDYKGGATYTICWTNEPSGTLFKWAPLTTVVESPQEVTA